MTLALSKEQKQYLDNSGIMNARTLQVVFKSSAKDQQRTLKQAAKISKRRK